MDHTLPIPAWCPLKKVTAVEANVKELEWKSIQESK